MIRITKRLRGILNAWHFQFDSALVFTAQWFRLGGGVVHPLTRRYELPRIRRKVWQF
ncbi:DUF3265 domain-containing protein [Vibrio vulnificus]|nr:DUF3265 domain-containing protein [Vibrio vulnificus]EGR0106963.1 DUF3265 domain-containing protein [Vibrio vulnificus]